MYGRNRRSPSPDRSGRSGKYQILIKNIAFEIDWKHLKDVIKDEGVEPKFAQIVENRGRSAGFGFAAFHSESDMRVALQRLARKNVGGRDLFVIQDNDLVELERLKEQKGIRDDRGDPGRKRQFGNAGPNKRGEATFEGVPIQDIPGLNTLDSETIESLGNGEVGPKLFVYNLIFEVSEQRIEDVFSWAGKVKQCGIPKKGHAIVEYFSKADALRALVMLRNFALGGRRLMIKMDGAPFAKHTTDNRSRDNYRDNSPHFDDRKRPKYDDYNQRGYPEDRHDSTGTHYGRESDSHTGHSYHERSSPKGCYSKKIALENLSLSVTTHQIRTMFESVGQVDFVQLSDGGRCDVQFYSDQVATAAVRKFDGHLLDGRNIKVYIN